jgi:signal peptidase I
MDDMKRENDIESTNDGIQMNGESVTNESIDNKNSDEKKGVTKRVIAEFFLYAAVLFICVFIVPKYVVQRTVVDGPSMENTLHSGENLIVDKVTYRFSSPKRFDIVMFYPYGKEEKEYYVKRVIGLPGETVQIIGSDIYINNKKLEENYGKEPITDAGNAADPITLGEDEYFVLGDNRAVSEDSRFSVGPVERDLIEGKCLIRIWPLNKFGNVE